MPDSYMLIAPGGGTQVNVASFTRAEPGADFGTRDLLTAKFTEAPYDNVSLLQEQAGVRAMSFPLIIAASRSIPNLGLEDTEALLRRLAQPGAVIDLKPQGATMATRFNVLAGRYELDYNVHQNREGLRFGQLKLDTEPFGYWPTQILLASVASVALPGTLALVGSIIGDVPGFVKIAYQPTSATSVAAGSWFNDFVAFALTHQASHIGHIQAASLGLYGDPIAVLTNDGFAPASQAVRYTASQNQGSWFQLTVFRLASAIEPAHRGRHRLYGWFRVEPSQHLPWFLSADVVAQTNPSAAMASYQPIATIAPAVASGTPGAYGAQASPAYTLLDLGEIGMPAGASGHGGAQRIRIWAAPATTNVGVASPVLLVGGLHLMPLDSDYAGVFPRGLAFPSILSPSSGKLTLDALNKYAVVSDTSLDLASANPAANAWQHYRGPLPRIASAVRLDIIAGSRKTQASGATAPVAHNAPAWAAVSVSYTPRFQFLKGL